MKLSTVAAVALAAAAAIALIYFFPPCWCARYSNYPTGTYYDEAPVTWMV